MEPRSRCDLATNVCVDHAGTHAVHDDEGAGWEQKTLVSPGECVLCISMTYLPSGPRASLVISSIVYMIRSLLLA